MSTASQNEKTETDTGRRNFLKLGLAGAGAAAIAAGGITAIKRMEGLPHDEFPLPIRDDFKRIDQRNQINIFANSKALNDKHPERNRSFNAQLKKENPQGYKEFHFYDDRYVYVGSLVSLLILSFSSILFHVFFYTTADICETAAFHTNKSSIVAVNILY